jgi:glycerol-3-phosphate acyltransferase PlsY
MSYIVTAIIAYLIGSVSFSVIFTKKFAGFDVREKGSGNAGSTNVLRTAGKKPAALTLLCDILKGVVAVGIAILIGLIVKADDNTKAILVQLAGIFVVVGHTYPIFFGFRGGKGVATALGVLLITNWQIGLICLLFALIIMAVFKIVSLGSIAAAILFPVLCMFLTQHFIVPGSTFSYIVFGIVMAAIVVFNHRANIKRMATGTENKLSFSEKKHN